eukprot:TRINITY_DN6149_c0_g1_i1.p1 TRINITY_DN6149_c0_g1~~TRINITY_DN6149_c0_g1_i1.p1  ORF type:complete len:462 (+),score=131.28 TRINITY_DN6149_c0_g1_i1:63-1388(+)
MKDEGVPLTLSNWGQNVQFAAARIVIPRDVGELQDLVRGAAAASSVGDRLRIRVVGSGHSFTRIADPQDARTGILVSLANLNKVRVISPEYVDVEGGVTFAQLEKELSQFGLALQNVPSIPHITFAGAVLTATHGSGTGFQTIAGQVDEIDTVLAPSGEVRTFNRFLEPELFKCAVVSFGCAGIVTRLRVRVRAEPEKGMRVRVLRGVTPQHVLGVKGGLQKIMNAGVSVSCFVEWSTLEIHSIWIRNFVGETKDSIEDPVVGIPVLGEIQAPGGERMLKAGRDCPSWEACHIFRSDEVLSGIGLQAEYMVRLQDSDAVVEALSKDLKARNAIGKIAKCCELRTVAADGLTLSHSCEHASLCIHFTLIADEAECLRHLPEIERVLKAFNARPHLAKLFTYTPEELWKVYGSDRMASFRSFITTLDPRGVFRNNLMNEIFQI